MKKILIFTLVSLFIFTNIDLVNANTSYATNDENRTEINNKFIPSEAEIGTEYLIYSSGEESISMTIVNFKPSLDPVGDRFLTSQPRFDYMYDKGTSYWSGVYPNGTYDIMFSKNSGIYSASYYMNFTVGSKPKINYIYSPALDGTLFSISVSQFDVLKDTPVSGNAAANYAWSGEVNISDVNLVRFNEFLKVEFNGIQTRIIWKI